MKYKLTMDGRLLYETDNEGLIVAELVSTRERNSSGELRFAVPPTHPYYEIIGTNKLIEFYANDEWLWAGEVISSSTSMNGVRYFDCLGLLYKFSQVALPYREEIKETVLEYVTWILENYNNSIKETKFNIQVGNISLEESIYRQSYYENAQVALSEKLVNRLGGYLYLRKESGQFYLDYAAKIGGITAQPIQFGRNLIDLLTENSQLDIYTAVIPLGAKLNEDTEKRLELDIDGRNYVYDEQAVQSFGWRYLYTEHGDITLPENLLNAGQKDLENNMYNLLTFELTAIDLAKLDVSIEGIKVGDTVRVKSEFHNIDEYIEVYKIVDDVLMPTNSIIYCGTSKKTLTENQVIVDKVVEEINKNYVTNEAIQGITDGIDDKIDLSVNQVRQEVSSTINQTSENILFEVAENYYTTGETDELIGVVSTSIEQTNDTIQFNFTKFTEDLNALNGSTDDRFNDISKYIRFVDGSIELGEVGNELTLLIENDKITFRQNGAEVAYFADRKLYVTDGQFLNSLIIGQFAYKPRSNGSLSFGRR